MAVEDYNVSENINQKQALSSASNDWWDIFGSVANTIGGLAQTGTNIYSQISGTGVYSKELASATAKANAYKQIVKYLIIGSGVAGIAILISKLAKGSKKR